jgi:hypothetical protein
MSTDCRPSEHARSVNPIRPETVVPFAARLEDTPVYLYRRTASTQAHAAFGIEIRSGDTGHRYLNPCRLCAQKIRLPVPDHFFDCLAVVQFLVEDFLRQHRQFRIARETKRHQLIHAEFGDARTELSWK